MPEQQQQESPQTNNNNPLSALLGGNLGKALGTVGLGTVAVLVAISLYTQRQVLLDTGLIGPEREKAIVDDATWKARVTDSLETISQDVEIMSQELTSYRAETLSRFSEVNVEVRNMQDSIRELRQQSGNRLYPNDLQSWVDETERILNSSITSPDGKPLLLPSVYSHMKREINGTRQD